MGCEEFVASCSWAGLCSAQRDFEQTRHHLHVFQPCMIHGSECMSVIRPPAEVLNSTYRCILLFLCHYIVEVCVCVLLSYMHISPGLTALVACRRTTPPSCMLCLSLLCYPSLSDHPCCMQTHHSAFLYVVSELVKIFCDEQAADVTMGPILARMIAIACSGLNNMQVGGGRFAIWCLGRDTIWCLEPGT
jgi:hypothetical protein